MPKVPRHELADLRGEGGRTKGWIAPAKDRRKKREEKERRRLEAQSFKARPAALEKESNVASAPAVVSTIGPKTKEKHVKGATPCGAVFGSPDCNAFSHDEKRKHICFVCPIQKRTAESNSETSLKFLPGITGCEDPASQPSIAAKA